MEMEEATRLVKRLAVSVAALRCAAMKGKSTVTARKIARSAVCNLLTALTGESPTAAQINEVLANVGSV